VVEVESALVRYRAWNLEDVDKPGLVLVHGFLAHARWWDHIAPSLTDRFRVIAPDLTGMGDSDRRASYSREQYARELVEAARHAGFDRAILVAHSMGSSCSLRASQLAPEFVERMIAIDGRMILREEPTVEVLEVPAERSYPSFEEARGSYRLIPPSESPIAEILDYIARHSIRRLAGNRCGWKFDPETFRMVQGGIAGRELHNLTVPVDFIHCAQSEVVQATDLALFQASIPNFGISVTLPLSHHHAMIEQPVALVAALNGLLARPVRILSDMLASGSMRKINRQMLVDTAEREVPNSIWKI
jgi:pimeloyl-ACP methyl ester carboxylesterase